MFNHAPLFALLASLVIFVIATAAKVIKLSREQRESSNMDVGQVPKSKATYGRYVLVGLILSLVAIALIV